MTILEDSILAMLAAASGPLTSARLLQWCHTYSPFLAFSWEEFVEVLCRLQSEGRVIEDTVGYSLKPVKSPEEIELDRQLGL